MRGWWRRTTARRPRALDAPLDASVAQLGRPPTGARVWRRVRDPQSFAFRRTETIRFLDSAVLRRRVTVDLAVDDQKPVPLALLQKRLLVNFDLRDGSGAAVPLLTTEQNIAVAVAALRAAAGAGVNPRMDRAFERIAGRAVLDGTETDSVPLDRLADELEAADLDLALLPDELLRAVGLFANGFLLLAAPARPGRHIFKFSYDEPFDPAPTRAARLLATHAGWRPYEVRLPMPGVGEARSYHLEVHAPTGVELVTVVTHAPGARGTVRTAGWAGVRHLHWPAAPVGTNATAYAELQAPRRGWLTRALLSTWLTTSVLVTGAVFTVEVTAHAGGTPALLVALNGVVAALLSRPGEHALAARLLQGRRLCVGVSALASLATAASLVIGVDPSLPAPVVAGWLQPLWTALAIITGLVAMLITLSWIRSPQPPTS